jgi:hypothetical protein
MLWKFGGTKFEIRNERNGLKISLTKVEWFTSHSLIPWLIWNCLKFNLFGSNLYLRWRRIMTISWNLWICWASFQNKLMASIKSIWSRIILLPMFLCFKAPITLNFYIFYLLSWWILARRKNFSSRIKIKSHFVFLKASLCWTIIYQFYWIRRFLFDVYN